MRLYLLVINAVDSLSYNVSVPAGQRGQLKEGFLNERLTTRYSSKYVGG
jgi:hypothetical protein